MWEENLKQYLEENKMEKIAVYGTGDVASRVVEISGASHVVCIVNEENTETYQNGMFVCGVEKLPLLNIDCIIIATEAAEAIQAYQKMKVENIKTKIINIFGRQMAEMYANVVQNEVEYGQRTLEDLKKQINESRIVAFDLDNTVFMQKKLHCFDFYKKIEEQLLRNYAGCELFALKILEYRKGNKYLSLKHIIEQVIVDEKMGEVEWDVVWDIVYTEIKRNFVPRKAVVEALKYALKEGKIVNLVEDMPEYRIDREFIERLLKDNQITGVDALLCTTETGRDKSTGLLEDIRLRYGEISCLYVGDDLANDIYMSKEYNFKTFWIKSPLALFQCVERRKWTDFECDTIRTFFEDTLERYFCHQFALCELEMSAQKRKDDMLKLQTMIQFKGKYHEDLKDDSTLTKLVFFSEPGDEPEKLEFQKYEHPKVSIVIPVYNQFFYTYNCLKSILFHTQDIPYEIIVADDCSTDAVKELEKVACGIRIIHNHKNLKFLLNCNNAAKSVRGDYIVFLNNDTQVQPGWLCSLVDLMECKDDAGIVGSKLLYPNGLLQEAGGILWKDGTAWNYGHMQNPDNSEFCYVKEADYISGAAIMIRRTLWNEIGGFDEAFAPAYYEDTDLAFEVRKRGYKVYLQPASLVVHYEGVSNGIDTSFGLKKYQVVNQNKFFQKWKDVLGHEHFTNGENLYLAKDRGQTKTQILVVDHYVPNFDKDAGGRCTFMYIKAFLNMGMKVTFIGDNYAKLTPYTDILEQMGVEVLYGDHYFSNQEKWLENNLKYFDYVYLQRPHISLKYIDLVRRFSRAKIFYFAHDLHHVRFQRDYEVTGNKDALCEAEKWKKIEENLFDKADVGHVVGSYEQAIVQKAFPDKPIRNIPLYIYENMPEHIEKDFSKRKDILFVGGFNHQPNIDAVLWFASQIFPQLLRRNPELVWHIVGSKAPQEIIDLTSKHIILEGFVSDEKLEELYRKCRLAVVPLRYGAGVKGKIVEAAYYQIPVVTTSIGGEGIDNEIGAFVVENDADKMADMIDELYFDYEHLRKMSDAGLELVKKYYTVEAAERVLRMDINIRS